MSKRRLGLKLTRDSIPIYSDQYGRKFIKINNGYFGEAYIDLPRDTESVLQVYGGNIIKHPTGRTKNPSDIIIKE